MSESYKSNISKVSFSLEKLDRQVGEAMARGLISGMREFESTNLRKQMTGRPGLKRQSGNLVESWSIRPMLGGSKSKSSGVRLGTRAKYARIHQYGGTIKHPGGTPYIIAGTPPSPRFLRKDGSYPKNVRFTQAHEITIPKRLHLIEDFKKYGRKLMKRHMLREMNKLPKRM